MTARDLEGIAVIGMAGRFPGAPSVAAFWDLLRDGVEGITRFTHDELSSAGVPEELLHHPQYVKAGGVLEGIEDFDAAFFGYSPKEAEIIDPQQRLFLECAWEAMEDAGYDPERCDGSIGVYAGSKVNSYLINNLLSRLHGSGSLDKFQVLLGNDKDYLTTRVSFQLNLKGPSVAVQTACSTSLAAVHMACEALLSGQCDIALAGGVAVRVPQRSGYLYRDGDVYSPDGHCRAFDEKGRGTVEGNGLGVVVLKRAADALAGGDTIRALIRGSALNNDGAVKIGFTAPSIEGQADVISEALDIAGVSPETIGYVEAHGTATALGDPIEVAALTRAFAAKTEKRGFCALGSVKTNIGHLDTAAGIASLIKAVLALEHRMIPPSLHFEVPNPEIEFEQTPFYVCSKIVPWKREHTPRRAGVSSFGIGGTNVHVVLEEAPEPEVRAATGAQLLVLSARTEAALKAKTEQLYDYLRRHPQVNLSNLAYTLQLGRKEFHHRRIFLCADTKEALQLLKSRDAGRCRSGYAASKEPKAIGLSSNAAKEPQLLWEIGTQWLSGDVVDWKHLHAANPRRIPLPTYPFQRTRYWLEPQETVAATRRSDDEKKEAPYHFSAPVWKESFQVASSRPSDDVRQRGPWIIFADEAGFARRLAMLLRERGADVTCVSIADGFQHLAAREYCLRPNSAEDYDRLFQALEKANLRAEAIVHAFTLGVSEPKTAEERGILSLWGVAQALGKQPSTALRDLRILSNELFDLSGMEPVVADKATLLGPVLAMPFEYPPLCSQCLDIRLPEPASAEERLLLTRLLEELSRPPRESVLAYRGKRRWERRFEPLDMLSAESVSSSILRQRGVYLITGGLGALGLAVARFLAAEVQARLVLLSRSAYARQREKPVEQALLELRRLGAEVLILQADVTSEEGMRQALQRVEQEFGAVHGVIHAAGIAGEQVMQRKERAVVAAVLAPKLSGARALEKLLRERPPDFLLLFSSLLSFWGRPGQADYAGANAALDAFAFSSSLPRTTSINWDAWQGLGMASRVHHIRQFEHPLLDHSFAGDDGETVLVSRFEQRRHWLFEEHRIMGSIVVPGTAIIELIRVAAAALFDSPECELRDLFFYAPIVLAEDELRWVVTVFAREPNGLSFRVASKKDDGEGKAIWQTHAQGTLHSLLAQPRSAIDLPAVRLLFASQTANNEKIRRSTFGPRWQSLRSYVARPEAGLVDLQLPPEFADDMAHFGLHPALFDVATSALIDQRSDEMFVPFSYKALRLYQPLPPQVSSYVTYAGEAEQGRHAVTCDAVIYDEHGTVLAEVNELVFVRLETRQQTGEHPRGALLTVQDRDRFDGYLSVEAQPGLPPSAGIDALRRILAGPYRPQLAVSRAPLLLPPNGPPPQTVNRSAPRKRSRHPRPSLATPYESPRNATEQALADLWCEALEFETIGVHDDFFELGGDSVMAIPIISGARERKIAISSHQLFEHHTIAKLAAVITPTGSLADATKPSPDAGDIEISLARDFDWQRNDVADLKLAFRRSAAGE